MFYVLAVLIVLAALAAVLSPSTRGALLAVLAGDVLVGVLLIAAGSYVLGVVALVAPGACLLGVAVALRRAGYAPQTFYRHFTDKVDILLAVYADWVAEERKAVMEAGSIRQAARGIRRFFERAEKTLHNVVVPLKRIG